MMTTNNNTANTADLERLARTAGKVLGLNRREQDGLRCELARHLNDEEGVQGLTSTMCVELESLGWDTDGAIDAMNRVYDALALA